MNQIEKCVDEWAGGTDEDFESWEEVVGELKQKLNKVAIPKDELVKFVPYEKHKKALMNCIPKDILRKKIGELSLIKNEEFGKLMAGRYRWQGFLECSNGILELLNSKEET